MILSSLQMQKRLMQTKVYYKLFYCVWKETSHEPLKVAVSKKSFPSAYIIDTTCFDECFFLYVIPGRRRFLFRFIVTQRFDATAMLLLFETSVLKEVYILYPFSHNKITMLLILNVQNNAANTKCPVLNKIMTRNEKCIKHKMLQLV